jgi:hypothetical protein
LGDGVEAEKLPGRALLTCTIGALSVNVAALGPVTVQVRVLVPTPPPIVAFAVVPTLKSTFDEEPAGTVDGCAATSVSASALFGMKVSVHNTAKVRIRATNVSFMGVSSRREA